MASYKSFKTTKTVCIQKSKSKRNICYKKNKNFYAAKVYRLLNFSPPLLNHCDSSFDDNVISNFIWFFRVITCHVAYKNPLQLLVHMFVAQDKLPLFKFLFSNLINDSIGAKLELSEYFRSQIYNWFAPTFSAVYINIIAYSVCV